MPRAMSSPNRLYTSEITALQRILKMSAVDGRIAEATKRRIATLVGALMGLLNDAQTGVDKQP